MIPTTMAFRKERNLCRLHVLKQYFGWMLSDINWQVCVTLPCALLIDTLFWAWISIYHVWRCQDTGRCSQFRFLYQKCGIITVPIIWYLNIMLKTNTWVCLSSQASNLTARYIKLQHRYWWASDVERTQSKK